LAALAAQYHLQHGEVASFAKGTGGAPLGPSPQLQQVLFAEPPVAAGHIAGPVVVGDDRLLVAKVLEHRAPQPKPLAEVRDTIVAALTKEQASQAALKAAQGAQAQLQGGAAFDAVAQQLKVTGEPAHFISRRDPSVQLQVRDAAFAMPAPAAGKPQFRALALNDGGAAVLELTAVRTAPGADQKEVAARGVQEAEQGGDIDVSAYREEVRRTADVKKNPKAFE
jgi:peptidyl-prolyl cis-trans isomerase D